MAPQRIITDTDKAPLVQVLALMCAVVAVLACCVRTATKIGMVKSLKVDDLLVIAATVFASGQVALTFIACENGLGRLFSSLDAKSADVYFKTQYAANALFICSMLCSKLAATMGIRLLSRQKQQWPLLVCDIVVGIWGFTSLVTTFFQCPIPAPWDYSSPAKCISLSAFWTYYSAANIVTDIAIIGMVVENLRRVQTSLGKKIFVISVFGSRILVIPAAAAQLYYSHKAFSSPDPSFSAWEPTIALQVVQCLSIFTVCAPNLKPFLDSLESGQIRMDDLRRQGKSSSNGYPSYHRGYSKNKGVLGSAQGSSSRSRSRSKDILASVASQQSHVHELVELPKPKDRAPETMSHDQKRSWDEQSHKSHSSQTILIRQTWQVDVQDAAGGAARGVQE
jgi:hypothetical protein